VLIGVLFIMPYVSVVVLCVFFFHGKAPLEVRCAKRRPIYQFPEWTILSHVSCFIQGEVIGSQVLLDSLHPHTTRASWCRWSPPVLQEKLLIAECDWCAILVQNPDMTAICRPNFAYIYLYSFGLRYIYLPRPHFL